ncbi:MAG: SurA N-terminal domain-containing protein [bacterium]
MKIKYLIMLLCMSFLASGCGTKSPILAKVRGESITIKEFEAQLQKLPSAYRAMFITREQKEKLLDQMIMEKLMVQEAIKEGLHRNKEIQQKLKWVKNQMLIEELIKIKVYDKVSVSDEEAKKFYDIHQKELHRLFKGKTFDEIKQKVKQIMLRDDAKTRLMFNSWIEGLKKEAKITKNLALLGGSKNEECEK